MERAITYLVLSWMWNLNSVGEHETRCCDAGSWQFTVYSILTVTMPASQFRLHDCQTHGPPTRWTFYCLHPSRDPHTDRNSYFCRFCRFLFRDCPQSVVLSATGHWGMCPASTTNSVFSSSLWAVHSPTATVYGCLSMQFSRGDVNRSLHLASVVVRFHFWSSPYVCVYASCAR